MPMNRTLTIIAILLLLPLAKTAIAADKPLTEAQRRDHYLQLIENFVGWAETSGKFQPDGPDGGAFAAAGQGVSWARGNANLLIGYAVLLDAYPTRKQFCSAKIPREQLVDHLRRAIRTVCLTNKNCARVSAPKSTWGGLSWQAAMEITNLAWAAHLMENELSANTRALVKEIVCKEADNLDKPIPTMRPGDTGSEDCSWNAPLPAFAACKYASDPRAAKWDELARKWAMNSCSVKADSSNMEMIDGRPVKDWMVSENLFPDYTLENHGFWSVPYQFCSELMGQAETAYLAFGRPVPAAISYRTDEIWRTIQGPLSLGDGDMLQPHGVDWGWKDYQHLMLYSWLATIHQNAAAGAFESQALQMVLKRQKACGGGDMKSLDFGYQTVLIGRWAGSYLMHRYAPEKLLMPTEAAERSVDGVHVYPYVKTLIHRAPEKTVSVSWHPASQSVLVLPRDTRDAPFFFVFERHSGSASVKVSRNGKPLPMTVPPAKIDPKTNAVRVSYRREWGDAVTQHITVVSLPHGVTVYLTAFQAHGDADVELGPLFPQRVAQLPGLPSGIHQYRGAKWLNLSDRIGFVSANPLPEVIPPDRFQLTQAEKLSVKKDQWFGRGALVIYTGQSHPRTEALAGETTLTEPTPGDLTLTLTTPDGPTSIALDAGE